jgi:hypothetical protein
MSKVLLISLLVILHVLEMGSEVLIFNFSFQCTSLFIDKILGLVHILFTLCCSLRESDSSLCELLEILSIFFCIWNIADKLIQKTNNKVVHMDCVPALSQLILFDLDLEVLGFSLDLSISRLLSLSPFFLDLSCNWLLIINLLLQPCNDSSGFSCKDVLIFFTSGILDLLLLTGNCVVDSLDELRSVIRLCLQLFNHAEFVKTVQFVLNSAQICP